MACKLSRTRKKHLTQLVKINKAGRSLSYRMVDSFSNDRSYRTQMQKTLRNRFYKDSYTAEWDFDNIEFANNYLAINDINFDMYIIVKRYYSSKVKRSRVKNVNMSTFGMTIFEYNRYSNRNMNPVSMYYKIMSKK